MSSLQESAGAQQLSEGAVPEAVPVQVTVRSQDTFDDSETRPSSTEQTSAEHAQLGLYSTAGNAVHELTNVDLEPKTSALGLSEESSSGEPNQTSLQGFGNSEIMAPSPIMTAAEAVGTQQQISTGGTRHESLQDKALPDVNDDGLHTNDQRQDEGKVIERSRGSTEEEDLEIQDIMEQFDEKGSKNAAPMSPVAAETPSTPSKLSLLNAPVTTQALRPPRKSSLEPTQHLLQNVEKNDLTIKSMVLGPPHSMSSSTVTSNSEAAQGPNSSQVDQYGTADAALPMSPLSSPSLRKTLPPSPEPEPDLPFDFHRFLDQLRHRAADPVARYLRSFLLEFSKKQWMVHEQVKIISDFLNFIAGKMAQCEVWRDVSNAEFDNAREGMEKLVMNRLYSQTFSPAISPSAMPSYSRERKKSAERQMEKGRRGQHQEDIERDDVLAQKMRIYKWVCEEHLDIPPIESSGKRFLVLAQQELLKIKSYRAPRDKVICILNCCKVIFGLLRNSKKSDTSADSFMPLLIYVILQANPEHLVSNVQYIIRFRNQDKLGGEAGYYISSLMGAIQFIENLDRTSLTVSDEEFERNVEAAVSAITERELPTHEEPENGTKDRNYDTGISPETTHKLSAPERGTLSDTIEKNGTQDWTNEMAAVPGLLRSIQKPLSNIGRIFGEEPQPAREAKPQRTAAAPPETPGRLSPAIFEPSRESQNNQQTGGNSQTSRSTKLSAQDAAARQASAEAAEAQRIHLAEHNDVVETLAGMFPSLDKDIIDDVVRMKEGRVGSAVDACLALNTDT